MQATGGKSDEAKVEQQRASSKLSSQSRLGFVVESTCCIICSSSDFLLVSYAKIAGPFPHSLFTDEKCAKNYQPSV